MSALYYVPLRLIGVCLHFLLSLVHVFISSSPPPYHCGMFPSPRCFKIAECKAEVEVLTTEMTKAQEYDAKCVQP